MKTASAAYRENIFTAGMGVRAPRRKASDSELLVRSILIHIGEQAYASSD